MLHSKQHKRSIDVYVYATPPSSTPGPGWTSPHIFFLHCVNKRCDFCNMSTSTRANFGSSDEVFRSLKTKLGFKLDNILMWGTTTAHFLWAYNDWNLPGNIKNSIKASSQLNGILIGKTVWDETGRLPFESDRFSFWCSNPLSLCGLSPWWKQTQQPKPRLKSKQSGSISLQQGTGCQGKYKQSPQNNVRQPVQLCWLQTTENRDPVLSGKHLEGT